MIWVECSKSNTCHILPEILSHPIRLGFRTETFVTSREQKTPKHQNWMVRCDQIREHMCWALQGFSQHNDPKLLLRKAEGFVEAICVARKNMFVNFLIPHRFGELRGMMSILRDLPPSPMPKIPPRGKALLKGSSITQFTQSSPVTRPYF